MEHESFHDVKHGNEPFKLKLFRPEGGFWAVSYRDKHIFFEAVPRRLKAILLSLSGVMVEEGEGGIETLAGRILKALIGSRRELDMPTLAISKDRLATLLTTERQAEQRGLPFTMGYLIHMGMTERLREFLREDLSLSDGMKHVAVIGRAGSGKTTFINSIRGFYPVEHDSDALEFGHAPARAPVVRGRRLGPVRYQSLLTPGMVWWDMPSISNADDCLPPTVCFYRAYDLALYDYVILLYEGPMDSGEATVIFRLMRELKYVNTKPSILLVRTKADAQMKYSRETTSRSDAEIAAHIRNMNSTTLGGWVLQKFKTKIVSAMALWEAVSGEKSSSRGESIYQFDEQSLLEELKIPTQCRPELKRESFELYESWMRSCGGAPPPSTGLDLLKRQPFQFYESNVRSCRGSPPP